MQPTASLPLHSYGSRVPDQHADRGRVEIIAWIIDLRTVRDDKDHIGLRCDVDMVARRRYAVDDGETTRRIDRHIHEEVQVGHDVAFAQTIFRQLEDEILATGMLISGRLAKPHGVAFAGATSRRRVVPAAGIRSDPRHHACLLYTSDAADEEDSVDLGGRRII